MLATQELEQLRVRKRELLVQSDQHRRAFQEEFAHIRALISQAVDSKGGRAAGFGSFFWTTAATAAVVALSRRHGSSGLFQKLNTSWRFLRSAYSVWKYWTNLVH